MKLSQTKWCMRQVPLAPQGMIIHTAQRQSALNKLLLIGDEQLYQLRGVASAQHLVILGNEQALPWIPGAIYLGQDQEAQHLWLPTHLKPNISLELFDRAITLAHGIGQYVIDPYRKALLPTRDALTLNRKRLQEVME